MLKKYLNNGLCFFTAATLSIATLAGCSSANPEAKAPEKFAPAPTEEPPVFDAAAGGGGKGDQGTRQADVLTLPGREK